MKFSLKTRDIAIIGIMSAILITVQVAFAFLPNIELVSLIIIISTLVFKWKTLYIIYIFVLVEGLIYGFTTYWICYLYVWTILMFFTILFKKNRSHFFWAILSGTFGLSFGLLCSIPYLFIGGVPLAISTFIVGIPFDIAHCIGNYVIALTLFKPLYNLLNWTKKNLLTQ